MNKRRSNQETIKLKIRANLENIYPNLDTEALTEKIYAIFQENVPVKMPQRQQKWSERTTYLITYGDSIVTPGEKPLETLHRFLRCYLKSTVKGIHILPFFPFSSDDGFAVIDFKQVDPKLGDWSHISAIAKDFTLMADLVINHISSESEWFRNFLAGKNPGAEYFITLPENTDVSSVVRPRAHDLLVPFETTTGKKHVWATFSDDQIDLDFSNPDVLLEAIEIIYLYLKQGIRTIRLDAIGFLWKEPGTKCIHLPQTHSLIKLFRVVMEAIEKKAVIITETNVPNLENLSYFGNLSEAHVIYNFSLPPLLLDALYRGSSEHLRTWMMSMPPAPFGCTYFNFTASHDGIGLRPAEGLLSKNELKSMIATAQHFGAEISTRKKEDGRKVPYEINISLFDAMQGTHAGKDYWQIERFLCSQIIMMSLEGIPAFYIHSLLATHNDHEAVQKHGRARLINRHKWQFDALMEKLDDPTSCHSIVFTRLKELIKIRCMQKAFHPNATQYTLRLDSSLFGFWRQSMKRDQSIFVICNLTDQTQILPLSEINLVITDAWLDLISGMKVRDIHDSIEFAPYQCIWLTNKF